MIHCQSCGSKNAEDARFCNMCGAKIAALGEAGGPKASAPPPAGPTGGGTSTGSAGSTGSTSSNAYSGTGSTLGNQTLAGIGVQSGGRAYAILAAAAVAFLALGAGLMWVMMHGGSGEEAATAPDGDPTTDDGVPGEELPPGVEPPDEATYLAGTRVVGRGTSGGGSGSSGASSSGTGTTSSSSGGSSGSSGSSGAAASSGARPSSSGGATVGASSGTRPSSSGSSGGRTSSGGTSSSSGSSGAATGSSGSGGSSGTTASSSSSGGSSGTASSSGAGSSGGPPPDWEGMEETIGDEPPDRELELYLGNVRRFIRSHYARQAQACFDHATALSGAGISGRVVIGFTIAGNGDTENVHVARNDSGIDTLGTCVANRVDSWRLPNPPGGEALTLEMPFNG